MRLTQPPSDGRSEGGAAAIEFAIILPLLLVLVAGIIDFGRLLYAEIIVSNAAREGVRMIAMGYSPAEAQTRVVAASPNINFVGGLGAPTVVSCPATASATDAASYTVTTADFEWLILDAFLPVPDRNAAATASMRCRG